MAMTMSTTLPVAGARLTSSKKVSAPRRAAVQVTDLKPFPPWQQLLLLVGACKRPEPYILELACRAAV